MEKVKMPHLMQLVDKVNKWYVYEEKPQEIDIGRVTLDLWYAFQQSDRSDGEFEMLVNALNTLSSFVLDMSPKVIGVCGAVADKLEEITKLVQKHLPDMADEVEKSKSMLREHDLELLNTVRANTKIPALRRIDTEKYGDFELVKLRANEINADGTINARGIGQFNESKQNTDSLQNLEQEVKAGHHDKSPVAIGNLTLKIGRMLDANPTQENVMIAIGILSDLFGSVDNDTQYIIIEAITHKLEYISLRYGYLLLQDFQDAIRKYIAGLRKLLIDKCELDGVVQTLRMVAHSTLHYDSDGFLDATSIDEEKNFYEIVSITPKDLKPNGSVPEREIIVEDRPQRSDDWDRGGNNGGGGGGNNPSSRAGGAGIPSRRGGVGRSPRRAAGSTPPPNVSDGWDQPPYSSNGGGTTPPLPPLPQPTDGTHGPGHKAALGSLPPPSDDDEPIRQVSIDYNGLKVDILDLILMAVLDSLFDRVEIVQGGAKFKLKPDVLRHNFPPYSFSYAGQQFGPNAYDDWYGVHIEDESFSWNYLEMYPYDIVLKSGRKVHVTHNRSRKIDKYDVRIDRLDSDQLYSTKDMLVGDKQEMSAITYACKFLEMAGAAPQITPEGDIYVADAYKIYLNDHVNLTQIKDDMTRLTEFIKLKSYPFKMRALESFGIAWTADGLLVPRELRQYTPDMVNKFWKTPPKIKVNGREIDTSSAFSPERGK